MHSHKSDTPDSADETVVDYNATILLGIEKSGAENYFLYIRRLGIDDNKGQDISIVTTDKSFRPIRSHNCSDHDDHYMKLKRV